MHGVKTMTAFNYRFYPAICLAKEMIDAGELGEIYHFRGTLPPGVDHGSAVPEGLAARQVGRRFGRARRPRRARDRPVALPRRRARLRSTGVLRTFIKERPGGTVDVDDAFEATVEFENGAIGTYEATRFAVGPQEPDAVGDQRLEGHARLFDSERQNELLVNMATRPPASQAQGFRNVLVSEAYHPYWEHWWPHGHMIGWEDNFVHELLHLLDVRQGGHADQPDRGATMEDGYRCAEICDAIVRSHETGQRPGDRRTGSL